MYYKIKIYFPIIKLILSQLKTLIWLFINLPFSDPLLHFSQEELLWNFFSLSSSPSPQFSESVCTVTHVWYNYDTLCVFSIKIAFRMFAVSHVWYNYDTSNVFSVKIAFRMFCSFSCTVQLQPPHHKTPGYSFYVFMFYFFLIYHFIFLKASLITWRPGGNFKTKTDFLRLSDPC